MALIVTGIGVGTALAMILLQLIVNHVHYSGVLIIPSLIFIIGAWPLWAGWSPSWLKSCSASLGVAGRGSGRDC